MAGNSISPQLIDQMVASDANEIGQFLAWLERRIYQWTTNCGTAAEMNALGYTVAASQNQIIQHLAPSTPASPEARPLPTPTTCGPT